MQDFTMGKPYMQDPLPKDFSSTMPEFLEMISILTWTCGDTICMLVPFISSGFNNRGNAGASTGSLGLFDNADETPCKGPLSELDLSGVVMETGDEFGTVGNGVCRKYDAADGSSCSDEWPPWSVTGGAGT